MFAVWTRLRPPEPAALSRATTTPLCSNLLQRLTVAPPIPPIPRLLHDTAVIVEQPIGSVYVLLQWQGPGAHADPAATYAADVFSDVLNQPGSRFQQRLVDSGLFESIGVNYYTLNNVGPITIEGETSPQKLKDARETIAKIAAVKDDDRGMVITLSGEVLFKTGKWDLKPGAMAKLDQV